MKQIIARQREFFNRNNTRDIDFRRKQLKTLHNALKENEPLLYDAIYKDFKKSEFDTYSTELAILYKDIREARKMLYKWIRKEKVGTGIFNFPATSYIYPEPLGVCLVIGAWNYPFQLSFAPVIAAIAAGNTVVLKPSELPSNSATAIAKIVNENFNPNFFTVVLGGVKETQELLKQKLDKIFFTGSTKVGRVVYQAAANNLTPVTLELGGKSPAIVTESCDLKIAARRIVWGKFLNAGQTCVAPDYILVHKSIKENFLKQIKSEIIQQDFHVENGNYVQIINNHNYKRLLKLIAPNKIYFGGESSALERHIQPTILKDVSFEDEVMQEEIFGPILPVISYDTLEEAIQKVKSLSPPLSCYVFTKSKKVKKKVLNEIPFGGGAFNDTIMHLTNSNLPFGGVGESGMGNYHGEAGFKTFSHYKGILDKATWLDPKVRYSPHSAFSLKVMKWLMK